MRRSTEALRPSHFLTLRPDAEGMSDKAFTAAIAKFMMALRRRCPEEHLEYLAVNEWRRGVRHAHALIRLGGPMSERALRRAVRAARGVAGLRVSAQPVRSVAGAVAYVFKHTRRPEKKAELAPKNYAGRPLYVSGRFLTKPLKELWVEVRAAHRERGLG